jgi:hypothetical protein
LLVSRGVSGQCNETPFFHNSRISTHTGPSGFLAGVAANEISRVVLVRPRGGRIQLRLSSDNAFLFDCRAYDRDNGCLCVVAGLYGYARDGRLVVSQRWRWPGSRLPAACRK